MAILFSYLNSWRIPMSLKNKTIVITGASRGIGRSIALKCAADGANIVIAAKSAEPHPKLEGTIHTVAAEVEAAGGKALAIQVDVRDETQVANMAKQAADTFGGIDVLVNNAGAIRLTNTEMTPAKSFDLMMGVNTRATFLASQACLPYLEKSGNAHILNLSPPISMKEKWLQNNLAYTITKYGMTMCSIGMAAEFREKGIAVNSMWPKTAVYTAAISWMMGEDAQKNCRKPDIVSDAAYALFNTENLEVTGQTLYDEDFLESQGTADFAAYACVPGNELLADFYVE